ncbi:acetyltransferase [Colletotrichum tofieldiae]|nr:acetyltransferase [Colletotrichum tofieldiae]
MLQDESFQPIDPQIIGPPPTSHDDPYNHYHPHHTDFQALLNATEAEETAEEAAAVDRDLDMLIEQGDDDEEEDGDEPMGEKEGRDKDVYSIGFING